MDNVVEMTLSRTVNVTNTDFIRKFVRQRIADDRLGGPPVELVQFNAIVLCTSGTGRHMVDFHDHEMRAGVVVWIRPGQVQRWSDVGDAFDATVVVFDSGAITDLTLFDHISGERAVVDLGADTDRARSLIEWVASDLETADDYATAAAAVSVLLRILARNRRTDAVDDSPRRLLADRFALSVEQHLDQRSVAWHARRIGASPRTLARATNEAMGKRPKEIIDGCVLLEARRRLAWSSDDIGTIARSLQFSEPSNFTKFFRHRAGLSPSAFRENLRTLHASEPRPIL